MKKLISVGVALALLAMVLVPGVVAAQIEPDTYSKIPFAIIGSGLELLADIIGALPPDMGIPDWIGTVLDMVAPFTAENLAWSVDMVAWGVSLFGEVLAGAQTIVEAMGMELPIDLADVADLCDTIACGLFYEWADVAADPWSPCD